MVHGPRIPMPTTNLQPCCPYLWQSVLSFHLCSVCANSNIPYSLFTLLSAVYSPNLHTHDLPLSPPLNTSSQDFSFVFQIHTVWAFNCYYYICGCKTKLQREKYCQACLRFTPTLYTMQHWFVKNPIKKVKI